MIWPTLAILLGLPLLVWSAERFIHGAAKTAGLLGVSPLFIGMFIIGFGTSAPEIIVSVFASLQGNGGLALGNVYGSNIANTTLIVGVTALICPIVVKSGIVRKELPILLAVTFLSIWQLTDLVFSQDEAFTLLGILLILISWSVWQSIKQPKDPLIADVEEAIQTANTGLKVYLFWLVAGLVLLIISSRILVWGAVEVAKYFQVSDLIIGLTIIGVGTSLPELISSVIAVRKNEHELAIGNVVGSNLFNLLAVAGIAGIINPVQVDATFLYRDGMIMAALTIALMVFCLGFKGPGRINRYEGFAFFACFILYNYYLITTQF